MNRRLYQSRKSLIATIITMILMASSIFASTRSVGADAGIYSKYGPKVDYILFKVYSGGQPAATQGLLNGEIDLMDWPLDKETYDNNIDNPDLVMAPLTMSDCYDIDINNLRWPTSDVTFRKAIAYLIPYEDFYTDVLGAYSGVLMDSIIWSEWTKWYNSGAQKYTYSPATALTILNDAGYDDWRGDRYLEWQAPNETIYDLPSLDFYVRNDDPLREYLGDMIAFELDAIGIPVTVYKGDSDYCGLYAYETYDYHLYTAGMGPFTDCQFLYDYYHSQFGVGWLPDPWAPNNVFFTNDTYDSWAETLKYAPDEETAIEACMKCQEIFMDQVPLIPVYHLAGSFAYRTKYGNWGGSEEQYAGKNWTGIVNSIWPTLTCGINDWWTMLNVHPQGVRGGVLRYGMSQDAQVINPVMQYWYQDAIILSPIYDTLVRFDPYSGDLIPGLAKEWTVGTWDNAGETATNVTFKLYQPIEWHDDVPLNSSDIAFTMNYTYAANSPIYYASVEPIYGIDTGNPYIETPSADTVTIYYGTNCAFWAIKLAGLVPIIPKHVWKTIPPEQCEENSEYNTQGKITGSGPFMYESRTPGQSWLLKANPKYFMGFGIIPGDCAGTDPMAMPWYDGQVFWQDMLVVLVGYGATPADPRWTNYSLERADFNYDNQIFWQDLLIVLVNYGKTSP